MVTIEQGYDEYESNALWLWCTRHSALQLSVFSKELPADSF